MPGIARSTERWGLFTNHALVMAYVCEHRDSTVREIAIAIGITERATSKMLADLQHAGIIVRQRTGRSNVYSMDFHRLAMFRRGNAGPPTPASFANGMINTLLQLSGDPTVGSAPARPADSSAFSGEQMSWGFFTNHLRALLAVTNNPDLTANEIADAVGVTERAAVGLLRQLEKEGMLTRFKEGRRNRYQLDVEAVRRFPRWSMGPWPLQQAIIDASVEGLQQLATAAGDTKPAEEPNNHASPPRSIAPMRRESQRATG